MPKGELPNCFDPYLRYAISTDFENFKLLDARKSRKSKSIDDRKLFLLVELIQAELVKQFQWKPSGPTRKVSLDEVEGFLRQNSIPDLFNLLPAAFSLHQNKLNVILDNGIRQALDGR